MKLLLILSIFTSIIFGKTISKEIAPSELIVYNKGYSLLKEQRSFRSGDNKEFITYPNVASSIVTDSVSISFDKPIQVFTQQYNYNTITLANLAKYHIGKNIEFKQDKTIKKGILKAVNPIIIETKTGIINLKNQSNLVFGSIPQTMSEKPYLEWQVDSSKAPNQHINTSVRYLVNKISWQSNYIFNIDEKSSKLDGWINIKNHSGKLYEDINLKVLAGDVNRVKSPTRYKKEARILMSAAYEVDRSEAQGYHLYTIPFRVTLKNKQNTQIKFIEEHNPKFKKELRFELSSPEYTPIEQRYKAIQSIKFLGLKRPIPSGTIRVYDVKRNIFLGEDWIDHKVKNEKFKIDIGHDINVILNIELTKRKKTNGKLYKTIEYKLQNGASVSKEIQLKIPLYGDWKYDIPSDIKYSIKNGVILVASVTLPKESKTKFSISFSKKTNNKKN